MAELIPCHGQHRSADGAQSLPAARGARGARAGRPSPRGPEMAGPGPGLRWASAGLRGRPHPGVQGWVQRQAPRCQQALPVQRPLLPGKGPPFRSSAGNGGEEPESESCLIISPPTPAKTRRPPACPHSAVLTEPWPESRGAGGDSPHCLSLLHRRPTIPGPHSGIFLLPQACSHSGSEPLCWAPPSATPLPGASLATSGEQRAGAALGVSGVGGGGQHLPGGKITLLSRGGSGEMYPHSVRGGCVSLEVEGKPGSRVTSS